MTDNGNTESSILPITDWTPVSDEGVYAETLVKRKMKGWAIAVYGLMALAVAATVVMILIGQLFLGGVMLVGFGIAIFIFWRFLKSEIEYIFVTDELQVDTIFSGETRKKGPRMTMNDIEEVKPVNAQDIAQFKKTPGLVVEDFTSGSKDAKVYSVKYAKVDSYRILLFEPDEKLLNTMWRVRPSKVKR